LRWPIAGGGVFSLLAIVVTCFFLPHSNQKMEAAKKNEKKKFEWTPYKELLQSSHIRSYLIQFTFYFFAFTIYVNGLALFLEHRFQWDGQPFGGRQISYVLTTIGIYTVLFQGFILGKLQKKWGEIKFLRIAFAAATVGYFLLGSVHEPLLLAFVLMFTVFGNSSIPQTLTGLISKNVSDTKQGVTMGVLFAVRSFCEIILPPIGGYLIERGELAIWAWVPCLFFILALVTNFRAKSLPQN
jgi:predicted MFS family arabinose efflux permease